MTEKGNTKKGVDERRARSLWLLSSCSHRKGYFGTQGPLCPVGGEIIGQWKQGGEAASVPNQTLRHNSINPPCALSAEARWGRTERDER